MSAHRVPAWPAIAAGLAAVLAAGLLWWSSRADGGQPRPVPVVERGVLPTSTQPAPVTQPSRVAVHRTVPAGSRLLIPALHVDAPVGRVRAVGGVMQVPADPRRVAWWRDGAAPGAPAGSAVLVGHINFHGVSGALAALPRLDPGDAVRLSEPGKPTLRYRVAAVRTYAKSHGLPPTAFDRQGPARLVLITCGGPFDPSTGNYEDNIVIYAAPA